MKLRIAILLSAALFVTAAFGQSDNSIHVNQFSGATVGALVANAQATCTTNTSVPCILILDASLAAWAPGTMPTLCSHCYLLDYRNGPPGGSGTPLILGSSTNPSPSFGGTVACTAALSGDYYQSTTDGSIWLCGLQPGHNYAWTDQNTQYPGGGGGGGGTGFNASVTCTNTGADFTALQNALNAINTAGGGSLIVNSSTSGAICDAASGGLIAYSGTAIYAPGVTFQGTPGTGAGILQNAQTAQTVLRTCTDVNMTVGSTTMTSASGCLTSTPILHESLWCPGAWIGGYDLGGNPTSPNDLHTTFVGENSSTSVTVASAPSAVTNPMTCKILAQDGNISIQGATFDITGGNGYGLYFLTAYGVSIRDVTTESFSSGISGLMMIDTHDSNIDNFHADSGTENQDGIDIGPASTKIHIGSLFCHVGDTCLAQFTYGGVLGEAGLAGDIFGTSIDSIEGNAMQAAIGFFGTVSKLAPPYTSASEQYQPAIHDTSVGRIIGDPVVSSGITQNWVGFSAAFTAGIGSVYNLHIGSISGNIWGAIFSVGNAGAVAHNGFLIGADLPSIQMSSDSYGTAAGAFNIANNSQVYNLTANFTQPNSSTVGVPTGTLDHTSSMYNSHISITNSLNDPTGNVAYIIQGTTVNSELDLNYFENAASTGGGLIGLDGSTDTNLAIKMNVIHGSGSSYIPGIIGVGLCNHTGGQNDCGAACSGGCPSTITNLSVLNSSDTAPASVNDMLIGANTSPTGITGLTVSGFNAINIAGGYCPGYSLTILGTQSYSNNTGGFCPDPTVASGMVSSSSGTSTTAHTFSTAFSAMPVCTAGATTNAGAWYFSTVPSTTSSGVITYATSGAQTFNETCTGSGGAW